MSENGGAAKASWFQPYWLFLLAGVVLTGLNAICKGALAEHLGVSWSWRQFWYGLISAEICAAIYFYGVGSLSPHWRPDAPTKESMAKQTLGAMKPSEGSHPLGPRMTTAVKPAASERGTQTIAVQALLEKKPDAGKPGS
jgi:hypothetical protein